jgi:hypothetical protein
MDHVVQSNAAQTEELSSTARVLASQADDLHSLVTRFKLGLLGARHSLFERAIRAAGSSGGSTRAFRLTRKTAGPS